MLMLSGLLLPHDHGRCGRRFDFRLRNMSVPVRYSIQVGPARRNVQIGRARARLQQKDPRADELISRAIIALLGYYRYTPLLIIIVPPRGSALLNACLPLV